MITLTLIAQGVAFSTFCAAFIIAIIKRKTLLDTTTRFSVIALLLILSIITFFNFGEKTEMLSGIEAYEGYLEILIFPLALFSLFSIRKDIDHLNLLKTRRDDQSKAMLLDSVTDSVVLHDSKGHLFYGNQMFASMTGIPQSKLNGLHLFDVINIDDRAFATKTIEALAQKDADTFELRIKSTSETEIPVEVKARRFLLDGQEQIVSVLRDVTERKALEQERDEVISRLKQAEKMESLGTLAGGIAHDFNNILVPIIGYSDMLSESFEPGSKTHDLSDKILQAAERARDIVRQILAFSRAKRESESAHPVFVHLILKEVMALVHEVLPSSVTLKTNISSCPPVISTASNIHRICLNLITNAWQALENHVGTVTVTLRETRPPSDNANKFPAWVQFSVSDTGKGMTETEQKRIFEPYFTTKPEGFGTGLGLSVVDGIVRDAEGNISVKSDPGNGTTITITLPGAEETQMRSPAKTHSMSPGNGNVLVVDDEEMVGEYLKEILEQHGYNVTLFFRSPEALGAITRTPSRWDLVVSDFTMPEMTGDLLAAEIRKVNPDIGFILCSGYSGQISHERYKELGIDGFILKPLRPLELTAKIEKVLLKKKAGEPS